MKNDATQTVVVAGLGRIWAGIVNPAVAVANKGIKIIFYYRKLINYYDERPPEVIKVTDSPLKGFGVFWKIMRSFYSNPSLLKKMSYKLCYPFISFTTALESGMGLFLLLRREKATHVDFYQNAPLTHLYAQIFVLTMMKIPVIAICTGGEILYWDKHSGARKFLVRWVLKKARCVMIKELYMKDIILKNGLASEEKIHFFHNKIFIKERNIKTTISKTPTVLFLNSFKPWRHADKIVEAAAILKKKGRTDINFLLVGKRKGEKSLLPLIVELGVKDCVKEFEFDKKTEKFWEKADIFVLPAEVVFCNNALLEAMERGIPPIVANVKGAERIIDNEKSGILVPIDANAIAEAIERLVDDRDLFRKLSSGARKKVVNDFNAENFARDFLPVYQKVWKC